MKLNLVIILCQGKKIKSTLWLIIQYVFAFVGTIICIWTQFFNNIRAFNWFENTLEELDRLKSEMIN